MDSDNDKAVDRQFALVMRLDRPEGTPEETKQQILAALTCDGQEIWTKNLEDKATVSRDDERAAVHEGIDHLLDQNMVNSGKVIRFPAPRLPQQIEVGDVVAVRFSAQEFIRYGFQVVAIAKALTDNKPADAGVNAHSWSAILLWKDTGDPGWRNANDTPTNPDGPTWIDLGDQYC